MKWAILALMIYNNQPARSHDAKWLITVSLLKKFTPNSNQRAAQRVLTLQAKEVKEHHDRYHLLHDHNNRHRKHDVTAIIQV